MYGEAVCFTAASGDEMILLSMGRGLYEGMIVLDEIKDTVWVGAAWEKILVAALILPKGTYYMGKLLFLSPNIDTH
ncbi:hypothetical protein D5086_001504 [Populus alba]|uniref:Uncharacterized protein n=1 Tax=Populus alba TaxID=43335 RepID=A0ACC4CZF9_POPAL